MDEFILVSHDELYGTRLIGTWNTYREAKDTMDNLYSQALNESELTEDEIERFCCCYGDVASVAPPHGRPYVTFNIFETFDDAEINKAGDLHFF